MSELEKLQREKYQLKRKKLILIQQIALIVLTILMVFSSIVYFKLNKNTYVYYQQEGNAIHKAYLSDNKFYDETYLNGSHAYIASLIEKMTADFSYKLTFDTNAVKYKYNYHIDAQLEVLDRSSKAPLYNPTYEIIPLTSASGVGNSFSIHKLVEIDFQKYSEHAYAYLNEFELKDTSTSLIVRMYVNVLGESETFVADHTDEYVVELRIPLCIPTFKPTVTTTIPAGEQKILANNNSIKTVFLVFAIILLVCDVLAIGFFIFYVISTRDKHIDYSRKVLRIVKNYKSYIQKINNAFDMDGYQILYPDAFTEMLEIRDTLQKPILMYENQDRTYTQFFIVADFHIIYLYEIKVEDFSDDNNDNGGNFQQENTQNIKQNKKEVLDLKEEDDSIEEVSSLDEEQKSNTDTSNVDAKEEETSESDEDDFDDLDDFDDEEEFEDFDDEDEMSDTASSNAKEDTSKNQTVEQNAISNDNKVDVVDVRFAKTPKEYKFDPNGEQLNKGDIVLVRTTNTYLKRKKKNANDMYLKRDEKKKAKVTTGNYRVDPSTLQYPLKKIIRVLKRADQPSNPTSSDQNETGIKEKRMTQDE